MVGLCDLQSLKYCLPLQPFPATLSTAQYQLPALGTNLASTLCSVQTAEGTRLSGETLEGREGAFIIQAFRRASILGLSALVWSIIPRASLHRDPASSPHHSRKPWSCATAPTPTEGCQAAPISLHTVHFGKSSLACPETADSLSPL